MLAGTVVELGLAVVVVGGATLLPPASVASVAAPLCTLASWGHRSCSSQRTACGRSSLSCNLVMQVEQHMHGLTCWPQILLQPAHSMR
eukprot:scaffold74927_cov20-Tisochrysis_lutea.AAC.4